jgi:hypothetical protein
MSQAIGARPIRVFVEHAWNAADRIGLCLPIGISAAG